MGVGGVNCETKNEYQGDSYVWWWDSFHSLPKKIVQICSPKILVMGGGCQKKKKQNKTKSEQWGSFLCLVIGPPLPPPPATFW